MTDKQRRDPAVRFWAKVNKTESCWLWTGTTGRGYGFFEGWVNGRLRHVRAHRWAYEALVGPIPAGLTIDHLCRVRNCVNPAHLEPVTNRVNTLRGVGPSALNVTRTHCPKGHPYDAANTYRDPDGQRRCRECHRIEMRLAYKRTQGLPA